MLPSLPSKAAFCLRRGDSRNWARPAKGRLTWFRLSIRPYAGCKNLNWRHRNELRGTQLPGLHPARRETAVLKIFDPQRYVRGFPRFFKLLANPLCVRHFLLRFERFEQTEKRPWIARVAIEFGSKHPLRFLVLAVASQCCAERLSHGVVPIRRFVVRQSVLDRHRAAPMHDGCLPIALSGSYARVQDFQRDIEHAAARLVAGLASRLGWTCRRELLSLCLGVHRVSLGCQGDPAGIVPQGPRHG